MSQPEIREYPLLPLLENASFVDDISEQEPSPLYPEDFKGLVESCRYLSFQCDSEVHQFHVFSGKGGFQKGNLCYVVAVLFASGSDEPAAEIRFDYNRRGTLIIAVKSLVSDFRWDYRAREPETTPPSGSSTSKSNESAGCFVATAAYESPLAPEVTIFRQFRDEILLASRFGTAFVNIYYLASPPLASLVSRHAFLRTITRRILLNPILYMIKK
jgi:hypothetical protein